MTDQNSVTNNDYHVEEDEFFTYSDDSEEDEVFEQSFQMDLGESSTQIPDEELNNPEHDEYVEDRESIHRDEGSSVTPDYISPGNTTYWTPLVPEEHKPKLGAIFQSELEAVLMYKAYALKGGFDVRQGTSRKMRTGDITVRYVLCNKEGNANVGVVDTSDIQHNKFERRKDMFRCDCKAKVIFHVIPGTKKFVLHDFIERHNHVLISKEHMYLSRARMQLDFCTDSMIKTLSHQNIGSTKSFRIISALQGGYGIHNGLLNDYKNSTKQLNCFVGGRDAALLCKKMHERKKYATNFTFKVKLKGTQLDAIFWADETAKFNYSQFGDVVSIDATFNTNRYDMVFVPFTGIDNHKRCVTFGAGLLSREDYTSYIWLLKTWLEAFGTQPALILSDQCLSMKKAVPEAFPQSEHRLCMWHITTKFPKKLSVEFKIPDFKKRLFGLIWNARITIPEFETGWDLMLKEYNLEKYDWLTEIYAFRERWIPAYFKHVPMAGLMRTTSLSESQNWAFTNTTLSGSMLISFMDTFDNAMERQRHNQTVNDFQTSTTFPKTITYLPYEPHAIKLYTRKVFYQVQHEIFHSDKSCFQKNVTSDDGVDTIIVLEYKKDITTTNTDNVDFDKQVEEYHYDNLITDTEFKVTHSTKEGTFNCTCNKFEHIGLLCRHIFCVLRFYRYTEIPSRYVLKRYCRDVIPSQLLTRRFHNSSYDIRADLNALESFSIVNECVSVLSTQPDKLKEYLDDQIKLKQKYVDDCPPQEIRTRKSTYEKLLGVTDGDLPDIQNPTQCNNKGRGKGSRGKRLKSNNEMFSAKAAKAKRLCSGCDQYVNHDKRNCPSRIEKQK